MPKEKKKLFVTLLIGFLLGSLWLITVRFINYQDDSVHYHANFAIYINGERETLESFAFYEEVASCGADALNNPKTRVHLHDETSHVVHVHDQAATWGHLFANLGFTLGNDVLKTDEGLFTAGDGKKLRFILNGKETRSIANHAIGNEDVLLIDYGTSSDQELQDRHSNITRDAADYNERYDPSACAGGQPATFSERLRHAVGL